MTWAIYVEGRDPDLDVIVRRRFGRDHDRKCARPEILTCALFECQQRDRCRLMDGDNGAYSALPSPRALCSRGYSDVL